MKNAYSDQPLIVGSSISGLLASHRMGERGIRHVLVGPPPGDGPRLGESLDLAGSISLPMWVPSLAKYFHPKRCVRAYLYDYCVEVVVDVSRSRNMLLSLLGFRPVSHLIHVDRVGFDSALFDQVTARAECAYSDTQVEDLNYDRRTDRIDAVTLTGGEELRPSFVVDGTGPRRLLAQAINLPYHSLSSKQRVVFTHYHSPRDLPQPQRDWRVATTLLRLRRDADGVDGTVWCIPLGRYVSIGVSADETEIGEHSSESVLETACYALHQAGIPCREVYPEPKPAVSGCFCHGQYERGVGANWVLSGPAYGSYWFPTSTGLALAMGAAEAAVGLIEGRTEVGEAYETLAREVHRAHERMSYFMHPNTPEPDSAASVAHMEPLIRANFVRAAVHAQIADRGRLVRQLGKLLERQVEGRQLGAIAMSVHPTGRPPARSAVPNGDQPASAPSVRRQTGWDNSPSKLMDTFSD